eukprot:CAMPEP_0196657626 /NCGR_PEP_ID=MMETSP1086-20130531/24493_1 /TAXON_ID=77921 /ORGANISM="Cyanoptyche  gloeocystis , Strain SAG4.97" /LENGTH=176 /DNA_ID=CAMNT_0041990819 /DNA_START=431 /DNA_END=962 /DNA_ORIENTATION=-
MPQARGARVARRGGRVIRTIAETHSMMLEMWITQVGIDSRLPTGSEPGGKFEFVEAAATRCESCWAALLGAAAETDDVMTAFVEEGSDRASAFDAFKSPKRTKAAMVAAAADAEITPVLEASTSSDLVRSLRHQYQVKGSSGRKIRGCDAASFGAVPNAIDFRISSAKGLDRLRAV